MYMAYWRVSLICVYKNTTVGLISLCTKKRINKMCTNKFWNINALKIVIGKLEICEVKISKVNVL